MIKPVGAKNTYLNETGSKCHFCKTKDAVAIAVSTEGIRIPCCDRCTPHKVQWLDHVEPIHPSTFSKNQTLGFSGADPEYKKKKFDNKRKKPKKATTAGQTEIAKFKERLKELKKLEQNKKSMNAKSDTTCCSYCGKPAGWRVVINEKVNGKFAEIFRCEMCVLPLRGKNWVKSIEKI